MSSAFTRGAVGLTLVLLQVHLMRSIELDPHDPLSHFLLGKWNWDIYQASSLYSFISSWIFFSPLPSYSLQEALTSFLEAEELKSGFLLLNRAMIAKTYIALGDLAAASHWIRFVRISKSKAVGDDDLKREMEELGKKMGV
jgi:hypothetical protein